MFRCSHKLSPGSALFMLTKDTVVKLSTPDRRCYTDISHFVCSMQHNTKLLLILPSPNHAHAPLLLTSLNGTNTTHFTPFHCNFKFLCHLNLSHFPFHAPRDMYIPHVATFLYYINVSTCTLSTAAILLYCAVCRSKIAS